MRKACAHAAIAPARIESIQAALALRDEVDRETPLLSKREWCATLRTTNTSGVPGVRRVSDRTGEHWIKDKRPRPDGSYRVRPYWTAVIEREDGAPLRRYFSVPRHGDSEARRLAIAQRQAWEAQRARGEPYTVQRIDAAGRAVEFGHDRAGDLAALHE
ncbi:MAG: hypothetical protein HYS20_09170 [Rhodocyclales bacterium]|nr:hypothetical protein [Rhodocyclales bacterium]